MRPRRGCAIAGAALAVLAARTAPGEAAAFPSGDVRVDVEVDARAKATVTETYALTAPLARATFELLDVACSPVGPVASSIDGRRVALDVSRRAAWTTLGAAPAAAAAGSTWRIEYSVRTAGGDAGVPIVVPTETLEGVAGVRGAAVTLAVTLAGDGEPTLPRFDREAGSRVWRAHLLALPSMVQVRLPVVAGACDTEVAGSSGGLEWRFAIFVTTMAIWVPVYLWWFGRRRPGEDE